MSSSQAMKYGGFYKLLLPSILQEKKLKIPKKFVKKYGHELSGAVTLAVPNDRIWIVTLRETEHNLWFYNGWPEFVEHYSICIGHFLLFKYEGVSNFSVHMYVLAPCEIKHHITTTKGIDDHGELRHILEEMEDDHVHENTTCRSCQNIINRPKPKEYTNWHGEAHRHQHERAKSNTFELQDSAEDVIWGSSDEEKQELEKNVTANSSYNPPESQTSLNEAKLDYVNLSGEEKIHLSMGASISCGADRDTWEGAVQFSTIHRRSSADDVEFCIADGKRQKQPETCARKKIKVDPNQLLTSQREDEVDKSFRFYESASASKRIATAEERERAIRAAKAFKPINPFCRVVLRPSYLYRGCVMYLPSFFAEKHLRGVSHFIKLEFTDGKQWPVRCLYRGYSAKLSQGWYEFTLENNLGEGDVCVFELLKSRDIVLKVTVFRVCKGVRG